MEKSSWKTNAYSFKLIANEILDLNILIIKIWHDEPEMCSFLLKNYISPLIWFSGSSSSANANGALNSISLTCICLIWKQTELDWRHFCALGETWIKNIGGRKYRQNLI